MYKMTFFLLISILVSSCFEVPEDGGYVVSENVVIADSLLDLQNANAVDIAHTYEGHQQGNFAERSDAYGPTNQWWAEMFCFKYGGMITFFNSGVDQSQKDAYNGGMADFGAYIHSSTYTTMWNTVAPLRGGVPPTVATYGGGTYAPFYSAARSYYLCGNISPQDTSCIGYGSGLTDLYWLSKPNTIRREAPYHTTEAAFKNTMAAIMPRIKSKNGFGNHFAHQQNLTPAQVERYFTIKDSLISGADMYQGSYNTIVEYWHVRESVDSIKYQGKTVDIYVHPDFPSSPYSRITTPLWVYFDLSGTVYAGNDITTSHGGKIRSMGNDKYYISVPANYTTGHMTFDITTTLTPDYIDLSNPSVSVSVSGTTNATITTNKQCTARVFRHLKTDVATKWSAWKTYGTFATTFSVTGMNTTLYDYKAGVATKEKKSTLSAQF